MDQRLYDKEGILAYLGNINSSTYEQWVKRGLVPGPVPHTRKYDRFAHDRYLDRAQGLVSAQGASEQASPLEEWLARAS